MWTSPGLLPSLWHQAQAGVLLERWEHVHSEKAPRARSDQRETSPSSPTTERLPFSPCPEATRLPCELQAVSLFWKTWAGSQDDRTPRNSATATPRRRVVDPAARNGGAKNQRQKKSTADQCCPSARWPSMDAPSLLLSASCKKSVWNYWTNFCLESEIWCLVWQVLCFLVCIGKEGFLTNT